jgi:DNA-binding CsgD family transcriptional regulator
MGSKRKDSPDPSCRALAQAHGVRPGARAAVRGVASRRITKYAQRASQILTGESSPRGGRSGQGRPRSRGTKTPQRATIRVPGAQPMRPFGRLMFPNEAWFLLTRSLRLSHRESQIVQAMFDDHKESAMASDLGISPHTIHTHIERLYRKLSVTSRVALVCRVFVEYLSLAVATDKDSSPRTPRHATSGRANSIRPSHSSLTSSSALADPAGSRVPRGADS